ncbi:MAG: ABC transporter ATP-binding protein [bacterium]
MSTATLAHPPSDSPPGVRVELQAVRRVYAEGPGGSPRVAVERFDATFEAGDFVALVGPSGCGKSTLLRLIAGLDAPSAGTVRVGNEGARHPGSIGYVFQDATLMPWRTIADNVALPLEIAGVPRGERRAAAEAALESVGLAGEGRVFPSQLSGGMRMRASIARALVAKPRLLLMDEPFAAVDEITRHGLDQQLRELWERSPLTLVFVTHSVAEAVYLARRVVVLSARPARLVEDWVMDLPARREAALRSDARYAELVGRVQAALSRGSVAGARS